MSQFTPLNVEQSIAKYLADQFQTEGHQIYWHDTEQTEGSGSTEITLLRSFPLDPTLLVGQGTTREVGMIKVPAFAIFMDRPETKEQDRMGIGESVFDWASSVRIDGFVDTEYEWYVYQNLLKDWFHIDTRIDLYDYQADINNASPALGSSTLGLTSTQVFRRELDFTNAARYYLFLSTTATYIE
jgi:hypothetical protein